MKRTLRRVGVRYRIRDLRPSPRPTQRWVLQNWKLRAYQEEVVEKAVATGHGLIDIGTSGGKTLLAAAILARLQLPTLYLVTTRTLLDQTIGNLRRYLGVEVGVIGQGRRDIRPLTAALIQGLDPAVQNLTQFEHGILLFDEGHHAAAITYQDLIRRINPRYHFYLSAVPFRNGQDQALLDALAGRCLTGGKYSAQFLIERGYACPIDVQIGHCRIHGEMTQKPFHDLYVEFIVCNEARNRRIAEIARRESRCSRSVLILVEHVRHGHELLGCLDRAARFVHGSTPRKELRGVTAAFAAGRTRILVATSGLFQEGVSIDGIHLLIQAGGLKSRTKVIQTIGRGMRRAPGKTACTYVDLYDDDAAGVLRAHARQRLKVLKEEGLHLSPRLVTEPEARQVNDVPPSWAHVPNSNRFVLVDRHGRICARAECLRKEHVPRKLCSRCKTPTMCETGGRITWRDEAA